MGKGRYFVFSFQTILPSTVTLVRAVTLIGMVCAICKSFRLLVSPSGRTEPSALPEGQGPARQARSVPISPGFAAGPGTVHLLSGARGLKTLAWRYKPCSNWGTISMPAQVLVQRLAFWFLL